MTQLEKIKNQVQQSLDENHHHVASNNAVVTTKESTGIFSPSKTVEVAANNTNNTAESVASRYQRTLNLLYKLGETHLEELAGKVRISLEKKNVSVDNLMKTSEQQIADFVSGHTNEMRNTIEKYEKALLQFHHDKVDYARNKYNNAKEEYLSVVRRVQRQVPHIAFSSTIGYFVLLTFIGFCEIPLNRVIFQRFGESDNITNIMAGTLGIAVPVLAHFIGMFWRQRSEMKEYFWKAVTFTSMFLVTNIGLALFRANILKEVVESAGDTVNSSDLYLNILIFAGITTLLFFIGVVAAYFRHDSSWSLEHTYDQYNKRKEELDNVMNESQELTEKVLHDCNDLQLNTFTKIEEQIRDLTIDQPNKILNETLDTVTERQKAIKYLSGLSEIIVSDYRVVASENNLEILSLETKQLV